MPFGAACREDGTVRFRLWAPKATTVSLRLVDLPDAEVPMVAQADGWFELITSQARNGSQYQFVIDGKRSVPDPVSRYQPFNVHGPSEVIDPGAFEWHDTNWSGRPWHEAVIYELHVGTFSPEGTYAGAENKLDYLAQVGVTAIELMPLADFPGERNWGYDGVLPYAPARCYGRPRELKRFIDAAHARNLMVLLDVVYNHFGPEGNYLWVYAPQFFTDRHCTPWGQAINFDGAGSRTVRDYFIHNALYWLEEYHFDGLRLDAVHALVDDSRPDMLAELAETVRHKLGSKRHIHLVLENDNNFARYLRRDSRGEPIWYNAQWDDDVHHALHILLTGETANHYGDYSEKPAGYLGRCLAEGFGYQGEASPFRNGVLRGEDSRELSPTSFVTFLQNHDQVGNRALGERIVRLTEPNALKAAMAILLLAPSPPLLFMGEEFGATTPFLFFCDFGPELAAKVTEGRRSEFPHFRQFKSEIPDPNSPDTFLHSKIDWNSVSQPPHDEWLRWYRTLLSVRRDEIVPRIKNIAVGKSQYEILSPCAVKVRWPFVEGGNLEVLANFSRDPLPLNRAPGGRVLYSSRGDDRGILASELASHSAVWLLS
jgi:maltooligosyltrehalose trehalohydrolase